MSFWTAGLSGLALFNPITALGKGVYDAYNYFKPNTNISNDVYGAAELGLSSSGSVIGGISEGVQNVLSAPKNIYTDAQKAVSSYADLSKSALSAFETGAKSASVIALIGGAVALYYLYKK